jgi:predicted murein hydrolase (TIGR00659 family)
MTDLWTFVQASPLAHLTLTLVAYQCGSWVYQRAGLHPLLNPVLIAVVIIVAVLVIGDIPYAEYFDGAQIIHFLLGPATVALAIPLYRQFDRVRASALAISVSLLCGCLTAILSALAIGAALGASRETLISLAAKSITSPVAMGVAEQLGGLPSLTAVLVISTGIIGAMFGPMVLNAMGIRDWATHGFPLGTAAGGIGTARAIQVNETAGAFAGLAMGLNALATAILLPIIWHFLF